MNPGQIVGAAWKIRAAAFRDLIIYFRNDPSIIVWEGGNQKVTDDHAKELRGFMDQYDPHGGRAYAHRRASTTDAKYMDVCVGTEGGREIASLPVVEGEYDREESPRRVWDDFSPPNFGYPEAKGQTYQLNSEQYAVNEVGQYVHKTFAANHAGGANWIFSDSTSGGRNTAEVSRASGEVDGVRLPKEAYYVCQAMFRDDPQVHIIGHWNYPANTKKTIYVASNCGEVELFLNGKSLGRGTVSDRFLFTFNDVVFAPGEIKAVAYYQGKAAATQVVHTVGDPVALRLTPITGPHGLQADGSDLVLLMWRPWTKMAGDARPSNNAWISTAPAPPSGAAVTTAASPVQSTIRTSTWSAASTAWPCVPHCSRAPSWFRPNARA